MCWNISSGWIKSGSETGFLSDGEKRRACMLQSIQARFRFLFDGKNEKAAERYAFLDYNGARLELIETEHETYRPSTPEHPFCPHLCFEAENMDSVLKMLRENELTILDGPNEIPNSEQWIYFADPDMNVLEYIVWLDKKRE